MIDARLRRPSFVLLVLSLCASIHLLTISISPTIWQDEVQIVDYGRNFLSHDPQWSISWSPAQQPVTPVSYLGPVMQEAAYRLLSPTILGPRLLSLAGAVAASYAMWLWLAARGAPALVSLALAVAFLLDPMFVQGYRGARVDAWVFALMLSACVLVRTPSSVRHALAGALVVVAGVMWPSAIFLVPLLLIEVRSARALPMMAAGGAVGTLLCALPLLPQLQSMLSDTAGVVQGASGERSAREIVTLLLSSFQQSPLLPIAGLVAVAAGGRRTLAIAVAGAAALLLMLQMSIYVHRTVYLMPYFVAAVAAWIGRADAERAPRWATALMAVFVLWAAGTSLVLRPALAWSAREARDPAALERAAAEWPSLHSRLVFLGAWEFYYVGRERGWRMVRGDPGMGPEAYRAMLEQLDYAIIPVHDPAAPVALLQEMGWRVTGQVTLPSPAARLLAGGETPPRRYDLYSRGGLGSMK